PRRQQSTGTGYREHRPPTGPTRRRPQSRFELGQHQRASVGRNSVGGNPRNPDRGPARSSGGPARERRSHPARTRPALPRSQLRLHLLDEFVERLAPEPGQRVRIAVQQAILLDRANDRDTEALADSHILRVPEIAPIALPLLLAALVL